MKTPTEKPQANESGNSYDITTWLTAAFGILMLLKLGIVISRHI